MRKGIGIIHCGFPETATRFAGWRAVPYAGKPWHGSRTRGNLKVIIVDDTHLRLRCL